MEQAAATRDQPRFCVYTHSRPDRTPFYVGKGQSARAFSLRSRNPHYANIVAKHGAENIIVRIVKRGLTEAQSFAAEREAIECLREFGYQLCNMSDGGEGQTGYRHTDETKKKIGVGASKALVGKKKSEAHRLSLSVSRKGCVSTFLGRRHSDESRALISEAAKAQWGAMTAEERAAFSNARRKPWTPEQRVKFMSHLGDIKAAVSAANKGRKVSAEAIEKRAVALRGRVRPDISDRLRGNQYARGLKHSLETRAKISAGVKERFAAKAAQATSDWRSGIGYRDELRCGQEAPDKPSENFRAQNEVRSTEGRKS